MLAPDTFIRERYLIARRVGAGTSGVYQAFDVDSKAQVVLKEISNEAGAGTALHEEFERTALLLAGMRHTNLPQVIDHFVEDDSALLVMAFVPGDDLAAMLERNGGPFAADRVLGWADQLLGALEYLHSREPPVIHGDIKPQNIKLTLNGTVMLLDAGLPKGSPLAAQQQRAVGARASSSHFLPPEQLAGVDADERSDLFAAAATLYYLLTGVLPVPADRREIIVSRGQPDPLLAPPAINRQIPAALGAVLMGALALDPERRPASAAEMRAALAGALHTPAVAAAVPAPTTSWLDPADAAAADRGDAAAEQAATGSVAPGQPFWRRAAFVLAGVVVLVLLVFLLLSRGGPGDTPTPRPTPQTIANVGAVATTEPLSTVQPAAEQAATAQARQTNDAAAEQAATAQTQQTTDAAEQAATAQIRQTTDAAAAQGATAEALAATSSAAATQTAAAQAQQPAPKNRSVPQPAPTRTPTPPLSMAVQRTEGSGADLKCINVRIFLPNGYNGNGWTLEAEGIGTAPFNSGGYSALCVPRERQEFRFSIRPPRGIRATGNRSVPARGGDNFVAYTKVGR